MRHFRLQRKQTNDSQGSTEVRSSELLKHTKPLTHISSPTRHHSSCKQASDHLRKSSFPHLQANEAIKDNINFLSQHHSSFSRTPTFRGSNSCVARPSTSFQIASKSSKGSDHTRRRNIMLSSSPFGQHNLTSTSGLSAVMSEAEPAAQNIRATTKVFGTDELLLLILECVPVHDRMPLL